MFKILLFSSASDQPATQEIQAVLVEVVPIDKAWTPAGLFGDSQVGPNHRLRESHLCRPFAGEFQITFKSKDFERWLKSGMRDLVLLLVHVVSTALRFVQPGAVRAVIAESVLVKHQLLILNRSWRRAPNLRILDRLIAGFCSLWIRLKRHRLAIAFKPSTFLNFHRAMVQRKYRLLFSPKQGRKPGPKGPTADLIQAVVEMKRRNPSWGCPQIAE